MRDPAIHITQSRLAELLLKSDTGLMTSIERAAWIVENAKPYSLTYRTQPKLTDKQNKKLTDARKIIDNELVKKFNSVYVNVARDLGNMHVNLVNAYSKDFATLQDVAKMAFEFVHSYQITPEAEGLRLYCDIGFELMNKKYALGKFKYYNNKIAERYKYYKEIHDDDFTEGSALFVKLWHAAMKHYGASVELIKFTPDKNVSFIYARKDADLIKADYKDYIRAQFEELSFLNSLPEISMFHGDQAITRYIQYMANKAAQGKKRDKDELDHITEEHKEYLKKIRS